MKHFKRILAIRLAKLAAILIRFFHLGNGAVFPGHLAQIIDPEILSALSSRVREKIIAVMGSLAPIAVPAADKNVRNRTIPSFRKIGKLYFF